MAFCTADEAESLVQPNPPWDEDSTPKKSEVVVLVDLIDAEIELAVLQGGYQLPLTTDIAQRFCKLTNMFGVAGLARESLVGTGNQTLDGQTVDYWAKYQANLKQIRTPGGLGEETKIAGMMRSLVTSRVVDGTDDDYSDNTPKVTRTNDF
jgi:hypothetical protein